MWQWGPHEGPCLRQRCWKEWTLGQEGDLYYHIVQTSDIPPRGGTVVIWLEVTPFGNKRTAAKVTLHWRMLTAPQMETPTMMIGKHPPRGQSSASAALAEASFIHSFIQPFTCFFSNKYLGSTY